MFYVNSWEFWENFQVSNIYVDIMYKKINMGCMSKYFLIFLNFFGCYMNFQFRENRSYNCNKM